MCLMNDGPLYLLFTAIKPRAINLKWREIMRKNGGNKITNTCMKLGFHMEKKIENNQIQHIFLFTACIF